LQNFSSALRGVIYRLDVSPKNPWDAGKYARGERSYCGVPGDASGLEMKINGHHPARYLLDGLPYGQSEVPFTVRRTHPACYEFADVAVTLTSQCEYNAADVYQYRTKLDAETSAASVVHSVFDHATGGWTNNAQDQETKALSTGPASLGAPWSETGTVRSRVAHTYTPWDREWQLLPRRQMRHGSARTHADRCGST
jgi:hypothetical protein